MSLANGSLVGRHGIFDSRCFNFGGGILYKMCLSMSWNSLSIAEGRVVCTLLRGNP